MADDPRTAQDVHALVEERGVRFIRLWFTDILGQLKSFSINASQLVDAFEGGMGFDGSSITGFNAIEESDMIAVPDPSTFAVLPWRPDEGAPVARMFADVQTPERQPYEGDPRHVLRKAEERAKAMGFEHFYVGPELEYFLFRDNKGTEVLDEGGYFDLTTLDAGSDVRRDTVLALEQLGIEVEYSHHEGGPSQHEIDLRYTDALKMADDVMTYRITVKEFAMKYGWHATFMPKPLFGENGSGCTPTSRCSATAQRVLRPGRQVLPLRRRQGVHRRPAAPRARAVLDLRPVGELLQAARARATRRPSTSPGRGATAPRSCACRCTTRARRRDPDGAALPRPGVQPVPHLRGLLQAGLEGIEKGYELPEPMEKNLYHLSPGRPQRLGIEQLPRPSARRSRSPRSPSSSCARSASTSSTATSRSSARSGRTTASRSRPGSSTATSPSSDPSAPSAPRVISVNVGRPADLRIGRRVVRSAIVKHPVEGRVAARGVNLEGDGQADRENHGGETQAVYAYAAEDAAWWSERLGRGLAPRRSARTSRWRGSISAPRESASAGGSGRSSCG
jgi:glutamine synthetase